LVSADIATFSAATLAAFAPSQASLAALSSVPEPICEHWPQSKRLQFKKGKGEVVRNHGKTQKQVGATAQNRHTLRGLSSLLKPDALSAKGEKFLHQM
jgi:hypothetical protein